MSESSSEIDSSNSEKEEQEPENEDDESENNEEESGNKEEDEDNENDSDNNESKNDVEESVNNNEDEESDDDNDESNKEKEEDENNTEEKNYRNSDDRDENDKIENKSEEEENISKDKSNGKEKKQLKEKDKKDKNKKKIKDGNKMKNDHKSNDRNKKEKIKENEEKKEKFHKNKINDKKRNEKESEENKEKNGKFKSHKNSHRTHLEKNNSKLYEKKINNSSLYNKQRQEALMNFSDNSEINEESCLSNNKNDFYLYNKDKKNYNKNIKEDNLSNHIMNNEVNLLNEKIKYLEAKNMRLDSLNQMYYDIIKSTNLQTINNNHNNNINYLKFQNLDYNPNYMNPYTNDLDFMINNYIDGERNKNINDFNNSMIDINKKITNYLIDNCIKEKENNNFMKKLEEVKNELNEKLIEINKTQKKQKNDIDFIIKYGLNKNKALDSILGIILEQPKPLPKLLRDDEKDRYKYDKVTNKNNITPYKNFNVYGRYTNKHENRNRDNMGVLKRTGSCVFSNSNNNDYNYKIDEDSDPHKYNHNIYPNYSKRPIFEKIEKNDNLNEYKKNLGPKNRSLIVGNEDKDEFFEKEKLEAYNNRYFVPKDFKFGTKMRKNYKYQINKNKKLNFLIDDI